MPIGLVLLAIMKYRISHSGKLFQQGKRNDASLYNWPQWAKTLGGFFQISMILLTPLVAIIQMYRYFSKGPPDILEVSYNSKSQRSSIINLIFSQRVELLFRPPIRNSEMHGNVTPPVFSARPNRLSREITLASERDNPITVASQNNDDPPKYSPPPSYSKATGAALISNFIRKSVRRSLRRVRSSFKATNNLRNTNQVNEDNFVCVNVTNEAANQIPMTTRPTSDLGATQTVENSNFGVSTDLIFEPVHRPSRSLSSLSFKKQFKNLLNRNMPRSNSSNNVSENVPGTSSSE